MSVYPNYRLLYATFVDEFHLYRYLCKFSSGLQRARKNGNNTLVDHVNFTICCIKFVTIKLMFYYCIYDVIGFILSTASNHLLWLIEDGRCQAVPVNFQ